MSRISSLASNTSLIQQMLKTQSNLEDLMQQVNSGKTSQDYAGIAPDSQRLINLTNQTDLLNQYIKNNNLEQTRLNIASSALTDIQKDINDFQNQLESFGQQGSYAETDVKSIQDAAFRSIKDIETLLNTEADGRFLFSGGAATTLPMDIGASSLADFQAKYDGQNVTVPTTSDANLKSFSFSSDTNNTNVKFIDGSNFLQFRRDSDGNSSTPGSSTIRASSAMFSDVAVGTTIQVTNTANNNGTYTVSAVSSDGTTVTVKTTMLTDETDLKNLTNETPAGAVSFKLPSGSTVTSGAGNITFNQSAGTITDAGGGGLFSSVKAGDIITVSGSTNNNGTVKVTAVDGTNSILTVEQVPTTISNASGTASVTNTDTGQLTFSRSGDSITAGTTNAFSGFSVGDTITVSGSGENDGTYTIASNDGTTIGIQAKKLTDEGLSADTSNDTDVKFTTGTNTIQVYKTGTTTPETGVFSNLSAGDTIEVTGSTSNNGTYTIASVSADGSYITVGSALTNETLTESATAVAKTIRLTDETDLGQVTNETPAGAVDFKLPDGSTLTSGAGNITFNSGAGTITDSGGSLFSNVSVGDIIDISGTTSNNGKVKVTASTSSVLTVTPLSTSVTDNTTATTVTNAGTGTLTFSRSGKSITAATAGAFTGFNVGDSITVAGTDKNNGTYTIESNTGTTIGIVPNELTTEKSNGNTVFDYSSDTDLQFTASSKKIEVLKSGLSTAVPNVFTNLQVGDKITVRGSSSNNGTYTIASIASDGSSVTVSESLTDETMVNDGTISGSGNGFSYSSGTQMKFVDNGTGSNTIQIQNSSGTAISSVFSSLKAGDTVTVSGTDANHDGTYTVKSVSTDGSQITINEAFPGAGGNYTDDTGADVQEYGASGTVAATPYFKGTDQSLTHRVDNDQSFQYDVTAASPGIEKAIRAMEIIMQGKFGTAGGLDQNKGRVKDALYLLGSSLNKTVAGNPPYGTEKTGSIQQLQEDVGFNQSLMNTVNQRQKDFVGFLQQSTSKIEDADPLTAITNLLNEQRALQASYQAFAKIRQLSLINYM